MGPFPTYVFTLEGTNSSAVRRVVQIRSASEPLAIEQAKRVGWQELTVTGSRPLTPEEDLDKLLIEVLNDPRFGVKWVTFFAALESWLGFLVDWPSFDLQILSPSNNYSRSGTLPQIRCIRGKSGNGEVWINSSKNAPSDHPGIVAIEHNGWIAPSHRFHLGHHYPLDERTFLSRAVYTALCAVTEFVDLTPDVFFSFFNYENLNKEALDHFHPVIHGDYTYYQLPAPEAAWRAKKDALTYSPLTSHVNRKLQPSEREDFIARWQATYPDCHTWSNDEILHWVTFGG